MAKKAEVKESNVENVEQNNVEYVNLTPNWENTKTWLFMCRNVLGQRFKTDSASRMFQHVDNAKSNSEMFKIYGDFAQKQIDFLNKRIETLKSIVEVARYEEQLCLKKEHEKKVE